MTYYFYILHRANRPKSDIKGYYYSKFENALIQGLETRNSLLIRVASNSLNRLQDSTIDSRTDYKLSNGKDSRYIEHFGVKETSREFYENELLKLKEEILQKMSDKDKKLLNNPKGWHFPFTVKASSRKELKEKLKLKFPEFNVFELKN